MVIGVANDGRKFAAYSLPGTQLLRRMVVPPLGGATKKAFLIVVLSRLL